MGIKGLLVALRGHDRRVHVSKFAGRTLAVDVLVWLHQGIVGCATELCTAGPSSTTRHVKYCMDRVELLIRYGVVPLVVFDGASLPSKDGTDAQRAASRARAMAAGNALLAAGQREAARMQFVKAVDVTPDIQHDLMLALRKRGVSFLVAPYEADAQLAFLCASGIADGVITEDSDTLPYRCSTVLFKMERDGSATAIERTPSAAFFRRHKCESGGKVDTISLAGFKDASFLDMCVLAGCDYCPSLPGIGLKNAWRLVRDRGGLQGAIRQLRADGALFGSDSYPADALRAKQTFVYQRVWDPVAGRCVTLRPPEAAAEWGVEPPDLACPAASAFLGPHREPDVATAIARGIIHPETLRPYPGEDLAQVPRALLPAPPDTRCGTPNAAPTPGSGPFTLLKPQVVGSALVTSRPSGLQAKITGAFRPASTTASSYFGSATSRTPVPNAPPSLPSPLGRRRAQRAATALPALYGVKVTAGAAPVGLLALSGTCAGEP
ncbi:hypothetical protein FNF29_01815 [Cafeteria roenbergensis]|uniref:Uncharacterized protein n=1 Tax=Cafeteria roenbergensis TaxID=33653 RepID=A0A5A8CTD2_CAFRO|nr:hypothetical protein FNF29_01815 [Cafeteria roenbergensis]|eukprot:KAA0155440.1 hypothetical protein FNF29_01815 [Cafeteria roenbergensis]